MLARYTKLDTKASAKIRPWKNSFLGLLREFERMIVVDARIRPTHTGRSKFQLDIRSIMH